MTITADKVVASTDKVGAQKTTAGEKGASGTDAAARPVLAHEKRQALGRGLESLLPGPRPAGAAPAVHPSATPVRPSPAAPLSTGSGPGQAGSAGVGTSQSGNASAGSSSIASTPPAGEAVPGTIPEIQAAAARRPTDGHEVLDLEIDRIDVNPHQTRSFTPLEIESLDELADSIKVQGVLQPITVRPGKDGRYFLITGERRMRASQMAGKKTVPAIVRVVSEQQAAEMTVIENLQRRDLTSIDLARAYIMLSKNFNMTQDQIGERVGVARETVSNYMRLAKLPQNVQQYLQNHELEFSHARILLNLDPEVVSRVAHKAVTEDWSVDQLERFVLFDPSMKGMYQKKEAKNVGARWVDPNVRAAQRELERILGVRVRISDRNGKGKITLEYGTLEDYDRIMEMLKGSR
jgi:ParB family transcriptional regulator, chromosome partitioning protein